MRTAVNGNSYIYRNFRRCFFLLFFAEVAAAELSFHPVVKTPIPSVGYIGSGDFNHDGIVDVVVASHDSMAIFLGESNGSFQLKGEFEIPADIGRPRGLVIDDFNDDKIDDLAVTTVDVAFEPNIISVFFGDGSGLFSTNHDYAVGTEPLSLIAGDFNNDEITDLASANRFSDNVSVLLGYGNGIFGSATNFPTDWGPVAVRAADFNHDGNLDLVTANADFGTVSILLGLGNGEFGSATQFSAGSIPFDLTIGDYNHDSELDVAVANAGTDYLTILLGNGFGGFGAPATYVVGQFPQRLTTADMNLDGISDLIVSRSKNGGIGENAITILQGADNGSFTNPINVFSVNVYYIARPDVVITDLNGDAKPDLAILADDVSVFAGYAIFAMLNSAPAPSAEQITITNILPLSETLTLYWITDPPVAGVSIYRCTDLIAEEWEECSQSNTWGHFTDDMLQRPHAFYLLQPAGFSPP